jgi:transposase
MLGLAPGIRESGDTRREGSILRSGNKRLRTALVEAAWRWVAGDLSAAKTYHRLVANTGSAKKAIVAMARKLGIVLWKITVTQTAYTTKPT